MNVRSPTNGGPPTRAWALVALLIFAAVAINPPVKVQPLNTMPGAASGTLAGGLTETRAAREPESIAATRGDDPPPALIEPAVLNPTGPASNPFDASKPRSLEVDRQTPSPPEPGVLLAPGPLDPDIVRAAVVINPPLAPAVVIPKPKPFVLKTETTSVTELESPDEATEIVQRFLSRGSADKPLFLSAAVDDTRLVSMPSPTPAAIDDLPLLPPIVPELSRAPTPGTTQSVSAPRQEPVEPTASSPRTSIDDVAGIVPAPADAETARPAAVSSIKPQEVKPRSDEQVEQTACAACGGFHSHAAGPALHESMTCSNGNCVPGRPPGGDEPSHDSDNVAAAFLHNLYDCLCSPDPCYEPKWEPAANASFFADYARPRTVTRLRYDNLENLVRPDRNQFWLMQVQPTKNNSRTITNLRARLQEVYLYQEAAGERGSFFIETGYRQLNPSYLPTQAGFSDMNFGVKSLFFDCELLQLSFQFRTFMPTGNGSLGLGTGHVSLDPSILASLKLGPDTYFQGQFGNWIPLGGNSALAGGIFYWLTSLNQVLWYARPDSPLIGTLEMDGWSFENGGYTNAILPGKKGQIVEKGGGVSYFNIGPGLRQVICNRMDFGGAITWATDTAHWAQPWFRLEARFLF